MSSRAVVAGAVSLALALLLAPVVAPAQPATTPPRLRQFVEAPYPSEALRRGTSASVLMEITLDDGGHVTAARVLQSGGAAFDEAALAAARDFVFDPARTRGRAVAVRIRYRYRFTPPPPRPTDEDAPRPLPASAPAPAPVPAAVSIPSSAPEFEATVRSRAVSREMHRRELVAEDLQRLPGTRGDALLAVQNLPGVNRPQLGLGQFIIRASNPEDTLVTLEGQPILLPFHFYGLATTIATDLIERIELLPGNFSARYGRVSGGVVQVTLRAPQRDRVHAAVDVDIIDAGLYASAPLGRRASVAIGGRISYLDALASLVVPAGYGFRQYPRYGDYQLALDADLGRRDSLRIVASGNDDRMVLDFSTPDPNDPTMRGNLGTQLAYHGLQARWRHAFASAVTHTFAPAVSTTFQDVSYGPDVRYRFTSHQVSLRDELEARLDRRTRLFVGLDLQAGRTDAELSAPPLSTNGISDPVTSVVRYAAARDFVNPAGYAEAEIDASRALRLLAGVRVDHFSMSGTTTVDPRVSLRLAVHPRVALRAGLGSYSTPARGYFVIPGFGNPDLGPESWWHLNAGFNLQLIPGVLDFDAVAFAKYGSHLIAPSDRVVRRDGVEESERFANTGHGRVLGGEWFLRLRPGRLPLFAWVSYTLQSARRQDGPDAPWYVSPYDQPHILTVVLGALLPHGWEVGLRARYTSGIVDPLVTGALYDADHDVARTFVDPLHPGRLPDFFALDVRVARRFRLGPVAMQVILEVLNATNNANAESRIYSYDRRTSTIVTGMPILPSLGLRGQY